MSIYKFNCQYCGKHKEVKKRQYKKCPLFCSKQCFLEYQSKNNNYMNLICFSCKKEFRAHRSKNCLKKNGNPKFCSIGCRDGGCPGFTWKNHTPEQLKIHIQMQFNKYVIRNEGCWRWKGRKDKDGYSILGVKNIKYRRAHRVS